MDEHAERDARAYDALLDIDRFLHPEDHLSYWHAQPPAEWPYGWDGESVYEWRTDTIEVVAEMVKRGLKV